MLWAGSAPLFSSCARLPDALSTPTTAPVASMLAVSSRFKHSSSLEPTCRSSPFIWSLWCPLGRFDQRNYWDRPYHEWMSLLPFLTPCTNPCLCDSYDTSSSLWASKDCRLIWLCLFCSKYCSWAWCLAVIIAWRARWSSIASLPRSSSTITGYAHLVLAKSSVSEVRESW